MTAAHFIYIPSVITVGLILGFIFGAKAARNAFDLELKREHERAEARARREARKAERARQEAENGGAENDDAA